MKAYFCFLGRGIAVIEYLDVGHKDALDAPAYAEDGNRYGPFKTLEECKDEALAYHRCDVQDAQLAIAEIKGYKARKLKGKK